MSEQKKPSLNQGQEKAAEGFFEFLLNEEREMILSGAGGVGKTFLMGYLIDTIMPSYHDTCKLMGISAVYQDVVMTATTNQAAEVLAQATGRPTETIHSLMSLRVENDYKTGETRLARTKSWAPIHNTIIFIDESSMIDRHLLKAIRETVINCKIIFVGDHSQLAPVKEKLSPIYENRLPFFELTEPMRNNSQPALMAICQQLRETVATEVFKPIKVVPGVIDWLDGPDMQAAVDSHFVTQDTQSRILAYTNDQVVGYNDYIRGLRQLPPEPTVGEILVLNTAIQLKNASMHVGEELEIIEMGDIEDLEVDEYDPDTTLQVRKMNLRNRRGNTYFDVVVPTDSVHFRELLEYYRKSKKWVVYYRMKNGIPELRPRDAATVHKSQGSTYDTVFIDMGNLSTCRQPDQVARLLYVAFTRARNRVVMYGDLADKFGGIIR